MQSEPSSTDVESTLPLLSKAIADAPVLDDSNSHDVWDLSTLPNEDSGFDEPIIAIFVINFDLKQGNQIEFQFPDDLDLSGVEFAAMASGQHRVEHDFVFFKRFQLFGLACFCRTAASAEERGARMRSVGVLMKHYASLGAHYPFLTEAASALNDNPGDFHRLLEYYQGHQRDVQVSHKALRSTNINRSTFFNWTKEFGLHTGSINRFYSRYGVGLFTVWKALLLGRRVLFCFSPPVGPSCEMVYAACHLLQATSSNARFNDPNPMFFVQVNDIDVLELLDSYIACTSDRIIVDKKHLYDIVLMEDGTVTFAEQSESSAIALTTGDHKRWTILQTKLDSAADDKQRELLLRKFFLELTNKLFDSLDKCHQTDGLLDVAELIIFGVDSSDLDFVRQIIRAYDYDITVNRKCCI